MFQRSVHQTMWLAKFFSNFVGDNIIVIVGEECGKEAVSWMVNSGDVMVITSGGTGVPKWFQPRRMLLDESFSMQKYSNRIWFAAVIGTQMQGTDCLLHFYPLDV